LRPLISGCIDMYKCWKAWLLALLAQTF
jgi:hypothetical protein